MQYNTKTKKSWIDSTYKAENANPIRWEWYKHTHFNQDSLINMGSGVRPQSSLKPGLFDARLLGAKAN